MLKADDTYKLITRYVFPITKVLSLTAIYTNLGFLPSIGEVTVADGEAWEGFNLKLFDEDDSTSKKPGMYITKEFEDFEEDDGTTSRRISTITIEGNAGWASKDDRNVWSLGFLEFDDWDQELLRNCKARIKRIFKRAYCYY